MSDLVKVLLVDDQVRNLEALQAVLHPSGCELVCAQSADEALLALLTHDFAAIVLDIRMPGMNGLELAQLIKGRKRTKHVPILFLTAHMQDERDILRGYQVGAVDYLTKPLDPQILRAKIDIFADLYRTSLDLAQANVRLKREISDRELAEEALKEANQKLETRVNLRTAEVVYANSVLAASEERLRIALDAGRMGTWELDELGRLCHLDDVQASLLGLPNGTRTVSLRALVSLTYVEDEERVREAVERATTMSVPVEGAVDYSHEFRIVRPSDGQVRWLHVKGRTFTTADGQLRRIGVSMDITDRKTVEQALQDADQRKNDFLATLAHELRNPLAPIRNAIELLRLKGPLQPEQKRSADVIDRQARALTRLVDDLLDISRITQGRLELRREPASLAAIVDAAVEASRPLIDGGGHKLVIDVPDEPITLLADVTRIAQVVSNLLNNAARYSEPNGLVQVSVRRRGGDAVITVTDAGIGIPPENIGRVFDMFVQLDRAQERGRSGLGVGLALSRQLVEMHGGHISAHSAGAGLGSAFEITLPIADEIEVSAPVTTTLADAPMTKLRLLVVDDNRDSVDSLSVLLRLMGNEVRMAFDGVEAVDVAGEYRPDVVLLDVGLPRRNGYDAARLIRSEPWGRDIVLIALTGWGQDQDRRRSREAGFDHHLVKPVDPRSLMQLLADVTSANRVPLPSTEASPATI
jgi:PAS domain S-box-containing protein